MINKSAVSRIEQEALRYLGKPYDAVTFNCMTFVRRVYQAVGLSLPPLELNVRISQLKDPPLGFVLYLKRKKLDTRKRFTHAAIVLGNRVCIHCSYYEGKVVITKLDDLLNAYDAVSM